MLINLFYSEDILWKVKTKYLIKLTSSDFFSYAIHHNAFNLSRNRMFEGFYGKLWVKTLRSKIFFLSEIFLKNIRKSQDIRGRRMLSL